MPYLVCTGTTAEMVRTRLPRRPSYRQLLLTIRADRKCLRKVVSSIEVTPALRLEARRCVERDNRMIARAGNGNGDNHRKSGQ